MNATRSIMLYGSPIWYQKALFATNYKHMRAADGRALVRITRAYNTVSYYARAALATTLPIELEAQRRALTYRKKKEILIAENEEDKERLKAENQEIEKMIWRKWQQKWETTKNAEWTKNFIPDVDEWRKNKKGGLTYHLTQFLTGHGCFAHYLHRIGAEKKPKCWFCGAGNDTAEHTFFECPEWSCERELLNEMIDRPVTIKNIKEALTSNQDNWRAIIDFVTEILRFKEEEEYSREHEGKKRRGEGWKRRKKKRLQ